MFPVIFRLPLAAHMAAAALSFGAFQWVKGRLDASYAASGHPVDYATGQLAFDARTIESYYAHMIEAGTLQVYWQTQFIDFGFIAAVMAVSLLFGTLAARFGERINRLGVWGWRLGIAAAILGVSGAAFDALENLLSFLILASPQAIPQPLALAYSTAAAVKFALLTTAMICLLLSIMAGAAGRIQSQYPKHANMHRPDMATAPTCYLARFAAARSKDRFGGAGCGVLPVLNDR